MKSYSDETAFGYFCIGLVGCLFLFVSFLIVQTVYAPTTPTTESVVAPLSTKTIKQPYTLAGLKVKDADTLYADYLNLPWGVSLTGVDMRMEDYDAWESSKRRSTETVQVDDAEVARGKKATADLVKQLSDHPYRILLPEGENYRDVYGRLLIRMEVFDDLKGEWIRLKDWMKKRNHLRS